VSRPIDPADSSRSVDVRLTIRQYDDVCRKALAARMAFADYIRARLRDDVSKVSAFDPPADRYPGSGSLLESAPPAR